MYLYCPRSIVFVCHCFNFKLIAAGDAQLLQLHCFCSLNFCCLDICRYADVLVHRLLAVSITADATYPDLLDKVF